MPQTRPEAEVDAGASLPAPNDAIRQLAPYAVKRHPAPIDLVLDANEGPPPSEKLRAELAATPVALLQRYPAGSALEAAVARRFDIDPQRVLVTAGGDEAIDRLCRAYLNPQTAILYHAPTFVMIPYYATLAGARHDAIEWLTDAFPLEQFIKRITPETRVIALVTPNNPTGRVIPPDAVHAIARAAPQSVVLVDHAYVEFVDGHSDAPAEHATQALLSQPNVLMLRTFSKAWGLAGLRVGYVLGTPQIIRALRTAGGPYSVARMAARLAQTALESHQDDMQRFVDAVRDERARLERQLTSLGCVVLPSQANFLLVRPPDAHWLSDACASLGIAIRHFGPGPLEPWVRITLPGNPHDFARLHTALQTAIKPTRAVVDTTDANSDAGRTLVLPLTHLRETDLQAGDWLFSESVEQIRAAQHASAVTIGLVPDGATPTTERLRRAGAARCYPTLRSALEQLGALAAPTASQTQEPC